jgi:formamidopyrimidine-DNA glycosylase
MAYGMGRERGKVAAGRSGTSGRSRRDERSGRSGRRRRRSGIFSRTGFLCSKCQAKAKAKAISG